MAWPKKGTRKIVIDGELWLWHYSGHCYLCSGSTVTVGRAGFPRYLYLDNWARDFEHAPRHIAASIRWALAQNWSTRTGPDRGLRATGQSFEWLPDGHRHVGDRFLGSNTVDVNRL